MAKQIFYHIKLNGRYLHGIKPNDLYCQTGRATTAGRLHTHSEYKTIWGNDPKEFEPLTMANYIRIITEEFRWEDRKENKIQIIPTLKKDC